MTTDPDRYVRATWWEWMPYLMGIGLVASGVRVWLARAEVTGNWFLRFSSLWDSIGLMSLGATVIAVGIALTILRVQRRSAALADVEAHRREQIHSAMLGQVADFTRMTNDISRMTNDYTRLTHDEVRKMRDELQDRYSAQVEAAQSATQQSAVEASEPDDLDDISLEGLREGDSSNLPVDSHSLSDTRFLEAVGTKQGIFYPVGAVPISVLGDIYAAWEEVGKTTNPWRVGNLIGAYRSYSSKLLEQGKKTLRGQPWLVTFRRTDGSLVTYQLVRTGKPLRNEKVKRPIVKRLVGEGSDARWEPLTANDPN